MTESEDKKEAWEHLCPELPPGATAEGDHYRWNGHYCHTSDDCWRAYTEATWDTRRAYAELITPQRVREAAEAKYGGAFEGYAFGFGADRGHVAMVSHMDDGRVVTSEHEGPDICTAAWAAIQEMKAK